MIPIDEILSGLKTYILNIISLINGSNTYDYESGYYNDSLNSQLSEYNDTLVISKLEGFLSILKSIKDDNIKKAIPDVDDDWIDSNYITNQRNNIRSGINDTIDFINKLIEPRKILLSTKMISIIDFPESVSNARLKQMGKYLKDKGMIDATPSFVDILRGEVTNTKIIWKFPQSHFNYFITQLFERLNLQGQKWILVDNIFTFPKKSIKDVDMAKNNGHLSIENQKLINTAISYLTD